MRITNKKLRSVISRLIIESQTLNESIQSGMTIGTAFSHPSLNIISEPDLGSLAGLKATHASYIFADKGVPVHAISPDDPLYSFVTQTGTGQSTGATGEKIIQHALQKSMMFNTNFVNSIEQMYPGLTATLGAEAGRDTADAAVESAIGRVNRGQFPGVDVIIGASKLEDIFEIRVNGSSPTPQNPTPQTFDLTLKDGVQFASAKESSGSGGVFRGQRNVNPAARHAPEISLQAHEVGRRAILNGLTGILMGFALNSTIVQAIALQHGITDVKAHLAGTDMRQITAANRLVLHQRLGELGLRQVNLEDVKGYSLSVVPSIQIQDISSGGTASRPFQGLTTDVNQQRVIAVLATQTTGRNFRFIFGPSGVTSQSGPTDNISAGTRSHNDIIAIYDFGTAVDVMRAGADIRNIISEMSNGVANINDFFKKLNFSMGKFDQEFKAMINSFRVKHGGSVAAETTALQATAERRLEEFDVEISQILSVFNELERKIALGPTGGQSQDVSTLMAMQTGGGPMRDKKQDYLLQVEPVKEIFEFLVDEERTIEELCETIAKKIITELNFRTHGETILNIRRQTAGQQMGTRFYSKALGKYVDQSAIAGFPAMRAKAKISDTRDSAGNRLFYTDPSSAKPLGRTRLEQPIDPADFLSQGSALNQELQNIADLLEGFGLASAGLASFFEALISFHTTEQLKESLSFELLDPEGIDNSEVVELYEQLETLVDINKDVMVLAIEYLQLVDEKFTKVKNIVDELVNAYKDNIMQTAQSNREALEKMAKEFETQQKKKSSFDYKEFAKAEKGNMPPPLADQEAMLAQNLQEAVYERILQKILYTAKKRR